MEDGSGRITRWAGVGIAAVASVLWLASHALWWRDFQWTSDAFEYGDVARNLSLGRGYVTQSLWPNDLSFYREPPFNYPLHRSPLDCLHLVPVVALLGTSSWTLLLPSLALYILLAFALWQIATRRFGVLIGGAATAFLLLNYNFLLHAQTGYPTLLYSALLTTALLFSAYQSGWRSGVAIGACLGLAFLSRPNVLPIAAVLIGLHAIRSMPTRRHRLSGLVAAAAVPTIVAGLVALPYLIVNTIRAGSPLAGSREVIFLFDTSQFPEGSIHGYTDPPKAVTYFRAHPGDLWRKMLRNLRQTPKLLTSTFRLVTLLFFAVGCWRALGDKDDRWFASFVLLAMGIQVPFDLLTVSNPRYLIPLAPAVSLLAGIGFAYTLVAAARRGRWLAAALVIGALVLAGRGWLGFPAVMEQEFGAKPHRAVAQYVRERVADSEAMVVSDISEAIAWYADQRSIRLPVDPEQLRLAEAKLGPFEWLFVVQSHQRRIWKEFFHSDKALADRLLEHEEVLDSGEPVADVYRLRPN